VNAPDRWTYFNAEAVGDHIDDEQVRWWFLGFVDGGRRPLDRAAPEGKHATPENQLAYKRGLEYRKDDGT
jgi:hypothetical protein